MSTREPRQPIDTEEENPKEPTPIPTSQTKNPRKCDFRMCSDTFVPLWCFYFRGRNVFESPQISTSRDVQLHRFGRITRDRAGSSLSTFPGEPLGGTVRSRPVLSLAPVSQGLVEQQTAAGLCPFTGPQNQVNYSCYNEPFAVSLFESLYLDMHGLIFEISTSVQAGSTRYLIDLRKVSYTVQQRLAADCRQSKGHSYTHNSLRVRTFTRVTLQTLRLVSYFLLGTPRLVRSRLAGYSLANRLPRLRAGPLTARNRKEIGAATDFPQPYGPSLQYRIPKDTLPDFGTLVDAWGNQCFPFDSFTASSGSTLIQEESTSKRRLNERGYYVPHHLRTTLLHIYRKVYKVPIREKNRTTKKRSG